VNNREGKSEYIVTINELKSDIHPYLYSIEQPVICYFYRRVIRRSRFASQIIHWVEDKVNGLSVWYKSGRYL
jgi:hypothetical protein